MNQWLPLIVWGKLMPLHDHKANCAAVGASLDCFQLRSPYTGMVIVADDRCPARFVNDPSGISGASANIEFVQHQDVRELANDPEQGLHLLRFDK